MLGAVPGTLTNEMTREELARNESRIAQGLETFKEVGTALLAIRDGRGYRFEYATFEDYCKERWGMERRHAYRLMDAANVISNVSNWTQIIPTNEAQARPLTQLNDNPDLQREAWQRAVETAPNGKITAAHVEQTIAQVLNKPHVANNSGNNEWYTPQEYIDAAIETMGRIDLDPASSEIANGTVCAKKIFTKDDDGLTKNWSGRVWMNPPYSGELIGRFCDKLAYHVNNDDVEEAIVLVNNATETAWFCKLVSVASAVVFPSSRVKFLDQSGKPTGAPLQGQAVVYIGGNCERFLDSFRSFGWGARL